MRCVRLLYLSLAAVWSLTVSTKGSPEDQPPPVTVRAREGESAILACDLPGNAVDRTTSVIEWLHQGLVLPIFIKFGIHPPRIDASYLGRLSLQEGTALRVERLRSDDGGWYQCRVLLLTQPYDNLNGSWVYLSITTPPSFRRTAPPVVEIRLGEAALLPCEAQGRPEPLVTWNKDGNELPVDSGRNGGACYTVTNGSLKIEPVDRSSMGLYTCEAKSEEGSITHSTELLVQGPPTIVLPPRNVTINFTQDAFFTCEAEAYPVNLSYSWFKERVNIHHLSNLRNRVNILTDGSLLLRETVAQDTGLYSCIASNGLGTPPEASANLTILHPAYARRMPQFTFLAAGMRGRIPCPIVAHPPLLYINWTRNGAALELDKLPGWYLEADGTIVMATGNDDALGDYACTPYNSYGTLGESNPTHVILKDPPRFVEQPAEKYEQEVGRELSISCSATGDPQPIVSWSKEGRSGRGSFQVLKDGTLFLSTISKEHHGDWTCEALNNVTQISTSTKVVVLGTSPHVPTNVTVCSDVFGVNVSWEPGFDGGHDQQFTVWVRQTTRGPHDWIIRKVPLSDSQLRVEGLWPGTGYQFSVLAENDRGSGPFSEIVTTWTLSVPVTTAPPRLPATNRPGLLLPPQGLAANRTARGVLLSWSPPPPPSRPPLGYRLEYRQDGGWGLLHSAIAAGQEQLLLEMLVQDYVYQFRISAVTEDLVSEPSNTVNISTSGMLVYPSGPRVRDALAHPIRAGIIAGCCFLATALVTSVFVSCLMSRRRTRRRRLDVPIIFSRYQKAPHPVRSDSPDSVLKLKFETTGYETFEAVPRSPRRLSGERHGQYERHLGCLESIRRGPDGRFMVELQQDPQSPRPAAYPLAARPEASPEFQGARAGVALRPKARGQTRVRPQARYFALATSSPAADSQPPCVPDLSPIPAAFSPQSRPVNSPGPGLHDDRPGLDSGPSRSLLDLGCGEAGAGGRSRGLSWPGPLEAAQPIPRPPGPCLGPAQPGPPADPQASGLAGGLGRRGVVCSPGLNPQASQSGCQALERPGASGPVPPDSIARPPSLAPSAGTGGSPAPDSSGFHSRESSQRAGGERSHVKRDISGDENYEWDAEFAVESEILEALRLYKRARPSRPTSSIVLQELERKGSPGMLELKGSRNVRSLEALCQPQSRRDPRATAASRCAALREEFLEYRRRKEMEERALGKGLNYDERFEQATLL